MTILALLAVSCAVQKIGLLLVGVLIGFVILGPNHPENRR